MLVTLAAVEDEGVFGEARLAAARAAWVTGTWMPNDGKERDLRRVLYGMTSDVQLIYGTRSSLMLCF